MRLLDLPPELRLQILEYLPDLYPGRYETVGPSVRLTPTICCTCRVLRYEALPLYVRDATFIISLHAEDTRLLKRGPEKGSGDSHSGTVEVGSGSSVGGGIRTGSSSGVRTVSVAAAARTSRVGTWLDALEAAGGLSHVGSLQLSRDWPQSRPSRWQCHVGFYVRLQRSGGANPGGRIGRRSGGSPSNGNGGQGWTCVTGTYPIANDRRQCRIESALVLREVVERWFNAGAGGTDSENNGGGYDGKRVLCRKDVEFVVAAMDVVASRPTPGYVIERNLGLWDKMLAGLKALEMAGGSGGSNRGILLQSEGDEQKRVSCFV